MTGEKGNGMGLNSTPASERVHIAFFGERNAGKSSLINGVSGQNLSIVSQIKGTTTDPVKKTMELLPLGPVVLIDTPGIDDEGELGDKRVERTMRILDQTDLAVLVVDYPGRMEGKDRDDRPESILSEREKKLVEEFKKKEIPYLLVYNKIDEDLAARQEKEEVCPNVLRVSAKTGWHIKELKERLAGMLSGEEEERFLVRDLLSPGDLVVLVIPIDKAAPKGRLILPQQQTMRDILDGGAFALALRDTELEQGLRLLGDRVKMVITDSQAFKRVSQIVDPKIPLTSFSILQARYRGDLKQAVEGAKALKNIKTGDRILISEGCTHHRQCGDIGTVKLPALIERYTGEKPEFAFTSGGDFPQDLLEYKLVIHCGGCMLNSREMKSRLARAKTQNIPMTNYGIAIAAMNGILERSIEFLA